MATLTELVATVVVQSAAAAFSHFGVTLEATQVEQRPQPVMERVVARSPREAARKVEKTSDCPNAHRAQVEKV